MCRCAQGQLFAEIFEWLAELGPSKSIPYRYYKDKIYDYVDSIMGQIPILFSSTLITLISVGLKMEYDAISCK